MDTKIKEAEVVDIDEYWHRFCQRLFQMGFLYFLYVYVCAVRLHAFWGLLAVC